ncbi:MAG: hypothetical protein KAH95_07075 [Spirochaetales bacterium]|nr:hypothetical protein [Spirochaetales bacterium]
MGKISSTARNKYTERIKEYKTQVEEILIKEKNILSIINKNPDESSNNRLILADDSLNMVSYYLLMNQLSITFLGVKNENMLNDARKRIYQAIIYLELVVTDYIDSPFSDYEDKLEMITDFNDRQRLDLIKKLGFSIASVKEGYGDNSRWKWSFVEIEGRFGTISKNFINLKTFVTGMDPRVEGYEIRTKHLSLVKDLLNDSAKRYREKYELSTFRIDDFKKAIQYLAALKRLLSMLGDTGSIDELKKKIDIWKAKMDADQRKNESGHKKK